MLTCALHMAHLLQRHLYDPGYVQLFQLRLQQLPACTIHVGTHHARSATTGKRSASTAWWELSITDVQGLFLFLNRVPSFFLWSTMVNPNLKGTMVLIQLTVISCIINSIFPFFNGTQARRAKILLTLFPQPVGSSMRLFYRKSVIMFRTSPISSLCILATRTLLSCSTQDTFEPDPMVLAFKEDSTSKGTWGMFLLIVRGLLRRPSLSGTQTVTFCSVHIHNVVAKKRDASIELLQRLHGYMKKHKVDFIGSDFNMSAFLSTVGDVFSDPEFSAPANSFLWGLGALEEQYRERTGFLIMPKRP